MFLILFPWLTKGLKLPSIIATHLKRQNMNTIPNTQLQHTSWNQKVEGLETVRKRARCPQGKDVRPRAGEVTKGSNFKQVHSTYCKPYWQQGVQGFFLRYTTNKQSHRNVPVLLAATGPQVFKAESRPQYSKTITTSQKGKRIKNRRKFHVPYCIQLYTTAFCIFSIIFSNMYHSSQDFFQIKTRHGYRNTNS